MNSKKLANVIFTVISVRTSPCTMAKGQWVTEVETAEGVVIDPFLLALDVPWDGVNGHALCVEELAAARRMIGVRFNVTGNMINGVLVALRFSQEKTTSKQQDLFDNYGGLQC